MTPEKHDFVIVRGSTFNPVIYYLQSGFTIVPITAITKSGQAVVTALAHGINLDRQWGFIVGVNGMTQINSREVEVFGTAYQFDVIDPNTVRLDANSTRFSDYISGGELLYHPPFDFSGYSATLRIKDSDGIELLTLTTLNGGIMPLDSTGQLKPVINSDDTAALAWDKAAYDFWVTDPLGVVTQFLYGGICVKVFNEPGCC